VGQLKHEAIMKRQKIKLEGGPLDGAEMEVDEHIFKSILAQGGLTLEWPFEEEKFDPMKFTVRANKPVTYQDRGMSSIDDQPIYDYESAYPLWYENDKDQIMEMIKGN
jgi:hypothetical protein